MTSSKIKILVDGHVLDGKYQGTSTYIAGLYSALSFDDRFDIHVATKDEESFDRFFHGVSNIKWVRLSGKGKYYRLTIEWPRIISEIKPDYCHFQYITPLLKNCKWINTIHDVLFLDFPHLFSWKYRIINACLFFIGARRADIVLTVSNYSKERIAKHFRLDRDAISVTPNGVSIMTIPDEPLDIVEPGKYYVYVSRFEPRKNQHSLLTAYINSELPDDIKLVFVGAKSMAYEEFDSLFDEIKAEGRVFHLSGISAGQLNWLYKNCIASIYPSFCEGFGLPPLEAAALGAKSYCSSNTALSELDGYVDGFFDAESNDSIRDVLDFSFRNASIKNRHMIQTKVFSDFSWEQAASVLASCIEKNNN